MNLALEFVPEALAEVECATGDYEAATAGLGVRFRREVESACAAILEHPLLWRIRRGGFRRVNLPGFPYYISFVLADRIVLVLAVAHASRHPDYWKTRMP
jgi:plasmid stabilization system protein ParE